MTKRPQSEPPAVEDSTATVSERPSQKPGRLPTPVSDDPETLDDIALPLRFEARRVLGRGGMGVVVEVLDRNLGREVAVKLLAADKRDPVHRVRFRREAKAAATLRHPNIVTVHDVDTERDFIVMELVRGESLRTRLKRERVLPAIELRRIALALLGALAAAHDAKIVHRDVKPANILIDDFGTIKLVDFGIASFGDRDLTSTGVRIGTPAYMAPEQLRGRVADVRADVYAVGATLFEAATGEQLHATDRTPQDISAAILDATGDGELANAIARAVADRPEDRFQTARDFADAIGPLPPALASPAANERSARRRRRLALAIVPLAIAAGFGIWRVARSGDEHDTAGVNADAKPKVHTIAVMPFTDRTTEARLDFASSGLSAILATELRSMPELKAFGYYDLVDQVSGETAPLAEWRAAARARGAELVIDGELVAERGAIRLVVKLSSMDGNELRRFERMAAVDAIPAATRSIAGEVARVAVGRSTPVSGEKRQFEIDRNLQLAIRALERQNFGVADDHLAKVESEQPELPEAQYYRALLNWWLSRDTETPITHALAGNLDPAQRGFLEGLRLVTNQTHLTPAIDHFRALAARFPDHRDIQYGLFEALYHGGYPAEAMVVYRRLCDRYPRFRLGLKHALAYYIGHADDDGIPWATARLDPASTESVLWQARAHVAQRDYPAAIAVLRRHEANDKTSTQAINRELAEIYLLDGQLGLVADIAGAWPLADMAQRAPLLLGLANARGSTTEAATWSNKASAAAELAIGNDVRERGWVELAAVELPDNRTDRLRQILPRLNPRGFINEVLAYALAAGAVGDRAGIEQVRTSEFPEVVEIANAYRAEWAKDWNRAAGHWARAAEIAADGNYTIIERLGAARAAKNRGDHAALLAACDEVIRPRRFAWTWGGAVGPCLRWSAEAAAALGRPEEASRLAKRLLALRSRAKPGDELVEAARAIAGK